MNPHHQLSSADSYGAACKRPCTILRRRFGQNEAAERRHNLARGASPWSGALNRRAPEGRHTKRCTLALLFYVAPPGLPAIAVLFQGLAPLAKLCRRSAAVLSANRARPFSPPGGPGRPTLKRQPRMGRDSIAQGAASGALGMRPDPAARPNGPRFLVREGARPVSESRPVGAVRTLMTDDPGLRCAAPWAIESRPLRGFRDGE